MAWEIVDKIISFMQIGAICFFFLIIWLEQRSDPKWSK